MNKTHAYFHSIWKEDMHAVPRFLWNAKMRFGKTFTTYQLARKLGAKRVLAVTFKPAVEDAWQTDLESDCPARRSVAQLHYRRAVCWLGLLHSSGCDSRVDCNCGAAHISGGLSDGGCRLLCAQNCEAAVRLEATPVLIATRANRRTTVTNVGRGTAFMVLVCNESGSIVEELASITPEASVDVRLTADISPNECRLLPRTDGTLAAVTVDGAVI
ncbi:MAG TPA: hypothetical protein VMO26_13805 [Vicinamibacterales bacterium]|nr:hypothetical protein [Vicinamibacterales bacterium]